MKTHGKDKPKKMYRDCKCGRYAFRGEYCLCMQNQNDEIMERPIVFEYDYKKSA